MIISAMLYIIAIMIAYIKNSTILVCTIGFISLLTFMLHIIYEIKEINK